MKPSILTFLLAACAPTTYHLPPVPLLDERCELIYEALDGCSIEICSYPDKEWLHVIKEDGFDYYQPCDSTCYEQELDFTINEVCNDEWTNI